MQNLDQHMSGSTWDYDIISSRKEMYTDLRAKAKTTMCHYPHHNEFCTHMG